MEDEAVALNDALPPSATALDSLRALAEGGRSGFSPPEAATLLGASIETVRRLIKAGQVHVFRDGRGRISISTSVTYTPEDNETEAGEPADPEALANLWSELRSTREALDAARAEESRLQGELQAAEAALEYTKSEVTNLWRVMTSRNFKEATRRAGEMTQSARIITLSEQRTRIRTKVADVRMLARRRKWPWRMVG